MLNSTPRQFFFHNTKTILLTMIFLAGLLSATAIQVVINPHAAFAGSDTYPAPWAPPTAWDTMYDSWHELNRECVSYAAWMLHSVNGFEMPFNADAYNWGSYASSRGYSVNMTPAVGSIYWKSSGSGHVAWVESVSSDGSTVTTEDYNVDGTSHVWGEHPGVSTSSASGYIHFKDTGFAGVGTNIYSGGNGMATGTTLLPGYYLASSNVQNALVFQTDGNVVLYGSGRMQWQTQTAGKNGTKLIMQTDGNLVLYTNTNGVVWASNSGGHTGSNAYNIMQDDGNFVVYPQSGGAYWQSVTGGNPNLTYNNSDRLLGSSGQSLTQGQYIRSSDNRYAVLLQTNGDAVLYGPGAHQLWHTNTAGHGDTFIQQTDGNLVLYALGVWQWQSYQSGSNNYSVIQTDGNFVQYSSTNSVLWQSGTNGKI